MSKQHQKLAYVLGSNWSILRVTKKLPFLEDQQLFTKKYGEQVVNYTLVEYKESYDVFFQYLFFDD